MMGLTAVDSDPYHSIPPRAALGAGLPQCSPSSSWSSGRSKLIRGHPNPRRTKPHVVPDNKNSDGSFQIRFFMLLIAENPAPLLSRSTAFTNRNMLVHTHASIEMGPFIRSSQWPEGAHR